jgi:hypothetical protein
MGSPDAYFCTHCPTINGMLAPQLAGPPHPSLETAPLEILSTKRAVKRNLVERIKVELD